jgi:hypothetical protein
MMKNLTKIIALILITISFIEPIKAQTTKKTDLILLVDKSEINGIIEEISETEIKYKKAENPSGPTYTLKKTGVYMIVYSNGEREKFAEASPKATTAPTTTPSSSVMDVPTNPKINAPSKVAEKKSKESPKPQPKKEEVKEQPTTAFETTSNEEDPFDNSIAFLDIGINLNNLGTQGAPITIVANAYNNAITKAISKNLFFGVNNSASFQSIDGGGFIPNSNTSIFSLSLGGRYYFNDLLKLDPNKFQLYGGATLLNFTNVSTSSGSQSNSSSKFSFQFVGRVGGRYGFSKLFGAFAELGFANGGTGIDAGISFLIRHKK